jgi:hypothetical protein
LLKLGGESNCPPPFPFYLFAFRFHFSSFILLTVLIFCCYTPAHEILYRDVFLPSVPSGFDVQASLVEISGPGDYLTKEFLRCIRAKLDLVVRSVEENPGKVIVWSDVDIRFFVLTPDVLVAELEASACDILFQRESHRLPDVNTGFFVCRCTPAVEGFFTAVCAELESHPEENEQMVVNRLLNGKCEIRNLECGMQYGKFGMGNFEEKFSVFGGSVFRGQSKKECGMGNPVMTWGYLPCSHYARTHGWPPPRKLSLYHANYTKGPDGIGQKMQQFQEIEWIQRHGRPARIWSVIRRVPGKLSEILGKTNRQA